MSPSLVRSLPFATAIALLVLADLTQSSLGSAWFYPAKVLVVGAILVALWRHYAELRLPRFTYRVLFLALACGVFVFGAWVQLDADWMLIGEPGPSFDASVTGGTAQAVLVGLRLLSAVLVAPLAEELFWRSFLQRWLVQKNFIALDPAHSRLLSIAVVSVLFGFAHQQWLAGIVAGFVYGWLYKSTRSLWAPVLAHMVTNAALSGYVLITGRRQFW